MVVETDYVYADQKISYEVTDECYRIYLDGKRWIYQPASGYIPFPKDTLEESCVAHIEDIVRGAEEAANEVVEDPLTEIPDGVEPIDESAGQVVTD